jgi:hypothetical protein
MDGRYQNCLHSHLLRSIPVSHCSVGLNCLYVPEFVPFTPTPSSTPHGSYPKLPLYVAYPFLSSLIPRSTHTSLCAPSPSVIHISISIELSPPLGLLAWCYTLLGVLILWEILGFALKIRPGMELLISKRELLELVIGLR